METRDSGHHRGDDQRDDDHLEHPHEKLADKPAGRHRVFDEGLQGCSLRRPRAHLAEQDRRQRSQHQRRENLPVRLDFHRPRNPNQGPEGGSMPGA